MAVFLGKQRMVATDTNVDSGMEARTTLAHDDVARNDLLAAEDLDAESFNL